VSQRAEQNGAFKDFRSARGARLFVRKDFREFGFLCIGAIENKSSAALSVKRRRSKTAAPVRALIDALGLESRDGY